MKLNRRQLRRLINEALNAGGYEKATTVGDLERYIRPWIDSVQDHYDYRSTPKIQKVFNELVNYSYSPNIPSAAKRLQVAVEDLVPSDRNADPAGFEGLMQLADYLRVNGNYPLAEYMHETLLQIHLQATS